MWLRVIEREHPWMKKFITNPSASKKLLSYIRDLPVDFSDRKGSARKKRRRRD